MPPQEEVDYLLTLRSHYSEIFHIDLRAGCLIPLYYNGDQVDMVPVPVDFSAVLHQRTSHHIHPDDLARVMAFYSPDRIRAGLEQDGLLELEYRRRGPKETEYRRMAAAILPMPGRPDDALLLLRDVTRRDIGEKSFYTALQNSYSHIYVVNLEDGLVRAVVGGQSVQAEEGSGPPFISTDGFPSIVQIHPEDRETFLAFHALDNFRSSRSESLSLPVEYRMRGPDGTWRWLEALAVPMPGDEPARMLVLARDITAGKRMENAVRRLERRYYTVFRQSCDILAELNLRTLAYTRTCFTLNFPPLPNTLSYAANIAAFLELVHPDDRDMVRRARNLDGLRRAFEAGEPPPAFQYRLAGPNGYLWVENRIFFLADDDPTVFFITRDISAQKHMEEERNREARRFALALRNIYTEVYELDLRRDTSALVFSPTGLIESPAARRDNFARLAKIMHPNDKARVAQILDAHRLRTRFAEGLKEEVVEFRRLDGDGGYRWFSASVVPLPEAEKSDRALLFLRDVSLRKTQERQQRVTERYDRALRCIYDELCEFNTTQGTYRLVYHSGKYVPPAEEGRTDEAVAYVAREILLPGDKDRFLAFLDMDAARNDFSRGVEYRMEEFRTKRTDGTYRWSSCTLFPVPGDPDSEDDKICLLYVMDIDVRKRAEELARQNTVLELQRLADERYRIIVEQTNTMVFEWTRANNARYVSPELPRRFAGRYDGSDVLQVWQRDGVVHPDDQEEFADFLLQTKTCSRPDMTIRLRQKNGGYIWCRVTLSCLRNNLGLVYRSIGTVNDVDDAVRSMRALQYRAEYDPLTGVLNMQTFCAKAAKLIREHPERQYYIVRMDIDRFKVINDLYGMETGDRVLKAIAAMLMERMTAHSVCGRLSSDVFCACVDYTQEEMLGMMEVITERLEHYPLPSRLVPAFGMCRVDDAATPIELLCDRANLALKTIKGNVLVNRAFYDETLRRRILDEKKIESDMRRALAMGEFHLYLQPKVHIPTARIIGAEGLVRWVHPDEGVIEPDRYIPLFEKNGFIIRLDECIWEQACRVLRSWMDRGLTPIPLSVNVSRVHIHDTRMCDKLLALIEKYRLPPHLLELELTESVFLDNNALWLDAIGTLQKHGFLLSLDDFGAGSSSLHMLKDLPMDVLKLDRGFLNEVVGTTRGRTIIRHVISLADDMDMKVVTEGVETGEQAALLLNAGCSVAQGFLYSRPVPVGAFENMAFGPDAPFPLLPGISRLIQPRS